jgi:hypothetical protein
MSTHSPAKRKEWQAVGDRAKRARYWHGVRYVAPWNDAPADWPRCLSCGRAWDDSKPTSYTPAPAARCPFEHWHKEIAS